ncbi:MAG: hypothetical protein WC321_01610 [Candidatus Omnitrophota bacterium]|jgi:hypothetical protein
MSGIQKLAFFGFIFLFLPSAVFAKEITVVYTGSTHAMLYPCHCPLEPDGGVSRRASLIRQLRKDYPELLLLDSGDFFAGGLMDEYAQNTDFDMRRTLLNLKAMELMGYDALAVGDDEFNFGKEFLEDNIVKTKPAFLACNLKSDKFSPYIIKEIAGIKIGITGLANPAVRNKAVGVEFNEPRTALKQAIEELKQRGAKIIVLLSHQGESDDLKLIRDVGGIDILITGHVYANEGASAQIGPTLLLRPSWQGRRLGKLTFEFKDGKIINPKIEELRLSDKVGDDPAIVSILPRCFSDGDCRKKDAEGKCVKPASPDARCQFKPLPKIKAGLLVITPRECMSCDTKNMVQQLKAVLPGISISYLYYPDPKSKKMVRELGVRGLPAYLFSRKIEKEKSFEKLKERLEMRGNFYLIKPEFSGISYFPGREKIKGKLDLFLSLYEGASAPLLESIRDFHPDIHFLATEQGSNFTAARGNLEAEEYLRAVCVRQYYPGQFWDYITCRAEHINTSWWEDCLGGPDSQKIKTCARSEEGRSLLRKNIGLNKELEVMFGPTYLWDNQEIFGIEGAPAKEHFKNIFKK